MMSATAPATPAAASPAVAPTPAPAPSTTVGAVISAIGSAFTGVFKNIAGLVGCIARLDKTGDAQLDKINETAKAAGTDFKTYLSSIFAKSAAPDQAIGLKIGNSALTMGSKGSYTKSGGASGLFEAVEAYAFAKSAFTNPALVKDGLHLQILNDGGATVKKATEYTPGDLKNLALCYVAVKASGLTVKNEAQLLNETFKDKDYHLEEARKAWTTFETVKEMADNPKFKAAKAGLDSITVETMKAAETAPVAATSSGAAPVGDTVTGAGPAEPGPEDTAAETSPEATLTGAHASVAPPTPVEGRTKVGDFVVTVKIEAAPPTPTAEAA